jgi:hypothetical protein
MFLRPGVVLGPEWVGAVNDFFAGPASDGMQAATFRPAARGLRGSMLREAIALVSASMFGKLDPDCGLIIHKRLYQQLGGHRAEAGEPEQDLMRRIGRARIVTLRSGASVPLR